MNNSSFHLDTAINNWLKQLRKYEGFEDGQIYEIEDHLRAEIAQLVEEGHSEKRAFHLAIKAFGELEIVDKEFGKYKARSALFWLLPSYLKIAIRKVRKHSTVHLLNMSMFSAGLAVAIFIFLFIRYEYSFDRFHEKGKNIYRLEAELFQSDQWIPSSLNSWYAGEVVWQNSLIVEEVVRITPGMGSFSYKANTFKEEKVGIVSQNYFKLFSTEIISGNADEAFSHPNNIIIDQNTAFKYFGDEDPMGKILVLEEYQQAMKVSAVIAPMPPNSHFSFNVLISFEGIKFQLSEQFFSNPGWTTCYTYLLIKEGKKTTDLESQFPEWIDKHFSTFDKTNLQLLLRPLFDIHLHAHSGEELGKNRDIKQLSILTYIGLAILFLSIFNFINLSTARYHNRLKEIGIRKVFGAFKASIRLQLFVEALLSTALAFLLAIGFIWGGSVLLNKFLHLKFQFSLSILDILYLLGGWFLSSILVGIYPSLVLPSIKVSDILTQKLGRVFSPYLRKSLVFLQYTITISLLIGLGILYKQMKFLIHSDPGYKTEHIVYFLKRGIADDKLETLRHELLREPEITSVGFSSIELPGPLQSSSFYRTDSIREEQKQVMKVVWIDEDFFETMDTPLVEGTYFEKEKGNGQIILNEAAVRQLGWANPIQQSFTPKGVSWTGKVVGVIKNFHFESLHHKIIPVAFIYGPQNTNWMYLRFNGDANSIVEKLGKIASPFYERPGTEIEPIFVNQEIEKQYEPDEHLFKLASIFTFLAVIIAGTGVFGLTLFIIQEKAKEIAIRKVIGADMRHICILIANEFITLIVLATMIAIPLSFWMSNNWLEDYPYRISLDASYFLFAVLLNLALTVLASGILIVKAAKQQPVRALRYEGQR